MIKSSVRESNQSPHQRDLAGISNTRNKTLHTSRQQNWSGRFPDEIYPISSKPHFTVFKLHNHKGVSDTRVEQSLSCISRTVRLNGIGNKHISKHRREHRLSTCSSFKQPRTDAKRNKPSSSGKRTAPRDYNAQPVKDYPQQRQHPPFPIHFHRCFTWNYPNPYLSTILRRR